MNQMKSFIQINNELRPFWDQLLSTVYPGSFFTARIVSTHTFEPTTSNVQENCVKIDPKDLSTQSVMLMELVNFHKDLIDPDYRTLYMLKPDKNFKSMPAIYSYAPYTDKSGNSRESYAIRVSDLTVVNRTHNSFGKSMFDPRTLPQVANASNGASSAPSSSSMPVGSGHAGSMPPATFGFAQSSGSSANPGTAAVANTHFTAPVEQESPEADDHISKMTIRDEYAIKWNKPVSFKPWLNQLIKENQN